MVKLALLGASSSTRSEFNSHQPFPLPLPLPLRNRINTQFTLPKKKKKKPTYRFSIELIFYEVTCKINEIFES